ncbi:MAG: hypothetical protein ABIQ31_18565 [Ferruginibacter sp.]
MKILVTNKDSIPDLQADIIELAMILDKLRHYTLQWENDYGAIPKNNKKYWEARADEWRRKYITHEANNTPGIEK